MEGNMKSTLVILLALCLAMAFSLAGTGSHADPNLFVRAATSHISNFQYEDPWISKKIDVGVNDHDESNPAAAYNSNRKDFLAAWVEHMILGESAIYTRRVGIDGKPKGSTFPIIHVPGKEYLHPDAAYGNDDLYLVV